MINIHVEMMLNSPVVPWEIIDEIIILTRNTFIAIKLGRFAILSRMIGKRPSSWAIENGQVKYLKYLYCCGQVDLDKVFRVSVKVAVLRNHINILEFCHSNLGGICDWNLLDYAASVGNLDVIKYLHSINSHSTHKAMDKASENGHLTVLKWLHCNRLEGCSTEAMDSAALNGHVDVLRWLQANRDEGCSTKAMYCAVLYGHLDVVKFLFEIGIDEVSRDSIRLARRNGQMEVVEFLNNANNPFL